MRQINCTEDALPTVLLMQLWRLGELSDMSSHPLFCVAVRKFFYD